MKRVDWTHFQEDLSGRLNGNTRVDFDEDIDSRLDELANTIHKALSVSASKSQPAKQPLVSIPPTILADIR